MRLTPRVGRMLACSVLLCACGSDGAPKPDSSSTSDLVSATDQEGGGSCAEWASWSCLAEGSLAVATCGPQTIACTATLCTFRQTPLGPEKQCAGLDLTGLSDCDRCKAAFDKGCY